MSIIDQAPTIEPDTGSGSPGDPGVGEAGEDGEAGGGGGTAGRTEGRSTWRRVAAAVALTLVALAPIIAVLIQRWGRVYVPVGDQAILDLRIRDVWSFSSDTPLTGPYSRFGWNHPGPTMYYLLALFSGVARQQAWASLVGNVLLQGVAVVWTARLSWKHGGLRWMVPWLAVITLSYWATGPWIFQQVWNPYLPYPFFTLLLLQAWLVGSGEGRRLVGMAFVGSFLIQTHVGYALPVVAVSLWAVVRLLVAEHRAGGRMRRWSLWWPPLLVLAVLWFVPLVVDTALHWPGNTYRLVEFYLGIGPVRHLPSLGIHSALGYLATEFRWRPPWLGGPDPVSQFTSLTAPSSPVWLVVPVVLVGLAWGLARRRRRPDLTALAELLAVVGVAGVVTLAVLTGPALPYLFLWRIPIGAATVVLGLVVVADTVLGTRPAGSARPAGSGRSAPWPRRAAVVLCLLLAGLTALASASVTRSVAAADGPVAPMEPVATSIISQLAREGAPTGPVLVRYSGSPLGGLHAAVVDQLAREGAPVFVDRGLGYQFGYTRTASPAQVKEVWYVTEESELTSLISRATGARVLAVSHPLPAPEQAELVALQRKVSDQLTAAGHADDVGDLFSEYVATALAPVAEQAGLAPADLQRLQALNAVVVRHVCLCAVIAFPADAVPSFLTSG